MFNNEEYKQQYEALEREHREIEVRKTDLIKKWIKDLTAYLNNNPTGYVKVSNYWYVKVDNISSGAVLPSNSSPVYWFRIEGLCFSVKRESRKTPRTIDDVFALNKTIKTGYTVEKCSKEEFQEKLTEVCNEVFSDSEANTMFQTMNYTSRFHDGIMQKYPDMFAEDVKRFLEKMEKIIEQELNETK